MQDTLHEKTKETTPCCASAGAAGSCCPGGSAQKIEKVRDVAGPVIGEDRGSYPTPLCPVRLVDTELTFSEKLGAWKARWGVGRMHYRVEPGLYATGNPTADSSVLVTANYKLTFDTLRSQLSGRSFWILVLETNGINVWCAAGKGTFGTEELVARIEAVGLSRVVSHRKLILPQLGAPGVSAHEVKRLSGFRVVYGPVRAADIMAFLDAGMKATPEMRRVAFPIRDRAVLIPIELVQSFKVSALLALAFLIISGLGRDGFSLGRMATIGATMALIMIVTGIAGTVFTPLLLPWLPGRSFSVKGLWVGLVLATAFSLVFNVHEQGYLTVAAWFLIVPAITSFLAMNFTGASTFTSLSGVKKEVRTALPFQGAAAALGVAVWFAGRFM